MMLKGKNRCGEVIVFDILLAIRRLSFGKKRVARYTQILQKANVNSTMMNKYVKELISKGLIGEGIKGGRRTFYLTEAGFKVLEEGEEK